MTGNNIGGATEKSLKSMRSNISPPKRVCTRKTDNGSALHQVYLLQEYTWIWVCRGGPRDTNQSGEGEGRRMKYR